jgi:hypothetical protein
MENVKYIKDEDPIKGTVTETVLIDKGNGEFVSMLKSAYDAQLADEAKTK